MSILGFYLSVFCIEGETNFMIMIDLLFELFVFHYHRNRWYLVDNFWGLSLLGLCIDFNLCLIEDHFLSQLLDFVSEPNKFGLLCSVFSSELLELFSDVSVRIVGVVKWGRTSISFLFCLIKNISALHCDFFPILSLILNFFFSK